MSYRDGAVCNSSYRSIRGYNSARNYNNNNATNTNTNIAFRPALKHIMTVQATACAA